MGFQIFGIIILFFSGIAMGQFPSNLPGHLSPIAQLLYFIETLIVIPGSIAVAIIMCIKFSWWYLLFGPLIGFSGIGVFVLIFQTTLSNPSYFFFKHFQVFLVTLFFIKIIFPNS